MGDILSRDEKNEDVEAAGWTSRTGNDRFYVSKCEAVEYVICYGRRETCGRRLLEKCDVR